MWLRRRISEAAGEGGQERSRRLETDADAVQIITVHTSKGLEFPVVMVPFAWDNWGGREPATAVFHDEHDHRVRDVGGPGSPDWAAHVRQHKQEETDDELRLTYVALTRAQSHLLLWWAPSFNTPTSPLHRLLLHDDPAAVAPLSITVPDDATAHGGLPRAGRPQQRRARHRGRCRRARPRCGHPPSSRRRRCSSRPSPATSTSAGGARPTAR